MNYREITLREAIHFKNGKKDPLLREIFPSMAETEFLAMRESQTTNTVSS